ncbi:non-specific lipid transfer protein GPI-anchored 2-like [Asparagus officinalis]|nr:non-specific lipid transfer protein GPI-anchored 2-like [Asparagus officinalis]
MALSNLILILLVTLSSSAFTGHCREQKVSDVSRMLTCMELLMQCQNHMSSPSPPQSCCVPLKRVIFHDPQCLCALSMNGDFLAYLNVTIKDAASLR